MGDSNSTHLFDQPVCSGMKTTLNAGMKPVKHKAEGLPGILGVSCDSLALAGGLPVLGSSGRSMLTLGEHMGRICNLQQV